MLKKKRENNRSIECETGTVNHIMNIERRKIAERVKYCKDINIDTLVKTNIPITTVRSCI